MQYAEELAGIEAEESARDASRTWRPLRFLSGYRILLSGLFLALTQLDKPLPPLGYTDPRLFLHVSAAYLAFGILSLVAAERRAPEFRLQLNVQVFADILAITLLMHASGGIGGGLGMLLVVSVANAGMIAEGRTATFFAAVASIALLAEQLVSEFLPFAAPPSYPHAGLLGATLFAMAILAHVLARRARESEALAARRGIDLANMAQLTDFIIQNMETGVLAVAPDGEIRFINGSAAGLLKLKSASAVGRNLAEAAPMLKKFAGDSNPSKVLTGIDGAEIRPRYQPIGPSGESGMLIFLDDVSQANQEAQQIKLAALGRLTASIAHEIRNPLGAISHAAELLGESADIEPGDKRLIDIIVDHCRRINTIIEKVLQLGRRDRSRPSQFELGDWLGGFVERFQQTSGAARQPVIIVPLIDELVVRFDETHLEQILTNLINNALHHTTPDSPARVLVTFGRDDDGSAYLEVKDNGKGIPDDVRPHLFEPFFTTGTKGTGLGLYLARELANCNRAELRDIPEDGGARFRLSFVRHVSGDAVK